MSHKLSRALAGERLNGSIFWRGSVGNGELAVGGNRALERTHQTKSPGLKNTEQCFNIV